MRIQIGTIRSDFYGFNSIASIAAETRDLSLDEVQLDFSNCSFFEANMAAPLYAVLTRLRFNLNNVTVDNLSTQVEAILNKNGFLTTFNVAATLKDTNQTVLPFKSFKMHAGEQFYEYLETYMKGRGIPSMSAALTKRFRQSLVEIFLNSAIHSRSELGVFACGQFFPQKHRLDFTVADAGIGIRESVRRYAGTKTNSVKAIEWALKEGNTTKKQPGGLGLKLIKDFISMNRGKLQLVSRYGYYEFSAKQETLRKMHHDLPGTSVNIEVNTQDTSSYCLKSELSSDDIL